MATPISPEAMLTREEVARRGYEPDALGMLWLSTKEGVCAPGFQFCYRCTDLILAVNRWFFVAASRDPVLIDDAAGTIQAYAWWITSVNGATPYQLLFAGDEQFIACLLAQIEEKPGLFASIRQELNRLRQCQSQPVPGRRT